MKVVMKFGGRCMEEGGMIRKSAEVIEKYLARGWKVVAVASAMAGATDSLLTALSKVEKGNVDYAYGFVEELKARHIEALKEAVRPPSLRMEVEEAIVNEVEELKKALSIIAYLKEVTPRVRDYVLSFGERLAARLLYGSLREMRINSTYLTGWDAGIVTDDNFGSASPLMTLTTKLLQERLVPLMEKGVPVVTGFIAATPEGVVTTLGRGGSDYTATIIGAALNVDEVILWKDVDGVMTSDPKLVPESRTVKFMSYDEVRELTYFGAKVIHPLALEPVARLGIAVRVKNILNPDGEGTLISKTEEKGIVKAITMVSGVAIVTVTAASMTEAPVLNIKVFESLSEVGAQVMMMSQGSSQASLSLAIPKASLEKAIKSIRKRLGGEEYRLEYEDDVCIIAVIGSGMRGKPGVAARVFNAVAREGINIRMIAQGASELNISFIVKESDGVRVVRALHREFILK